MVEGWFSHPLFVGTFFESGFFIFLLKSRGGFTHEAHKNKMPFAQVVIGPPGCGKTTYCLALRARLCAAGRRTALVNLDPANELALRPVRWLVPLG